MHNPPQGARFTPVSPPAAGPADPRLAPGRLTLLLHADGQPVRQLRIGYSHGTEELHTGPGEWVIHVHGVHAETVTALDGMADGGTDGTDPPPVPNGS